MRLRRLAVPAIVLLGLLAFPPAPAAPPTWPRIAHSTS